ncbi:putative lipase atg15 [Blyttiomyces sp. JEL0837]|nr:putative lipase atg15 [Blyttiomyces sp. JEL0837]
MTPPPSPSSATFKIIIHTIILIIICLVLFYPSTPVIEPTSASSTSSKPINKQSGQKSDSSHQKPHSTLKLSQVFHHGIVDDSTTASSSQSPLRNDYSRGFFRVMDVSDSKSRSTSNDDSATQTDEFTIKFKHGRIPRWSTLSPSYRMKQKRNVVDEEEEDEGEPVIWSKRKGGDDTLKVLHKDILLPDMSDTTTVLNLAKMTFNSYTEPDKPDWMNIPPWNVTDRFGWESDGIRGYVFTDDAKELIVVSLKGTSLLTPISGGQTAPRDKYNDNMMFSCCCGKAGWSWTPICDCATTSNQCAMSCMHERAQFADSYYNLANTIYTAVEAWYPKAATIWLTGHSLGGALASLVALTHDLPALAYEAPGDFMFAKRIGLVPELPPAEGNDTGVPPDYTPFLETLEIYHVGNTKDPIYVGACQGASSSCWYVGYALESRCHSGYECVYDQDEYNRNKTKTKAQKSRIWNRQEVRRPELLLVDNDNDGDDLPTYEESLTDSLDIRYHSIENMIKFYLEKWEYVPKCEVRPACSECAAWSWIEDDR